MYTAHIPLGIESWHRFLALSASLSRLLGEISCGDMYKGEKKFRVQCRATAGLYCIPVVFTYKILYFNTYHLHVK